MITSCALCGAKTNISTLEMACKDGILYKTREGRVVCVCNGCHGDNDPQRLYRKFNEQKFRRVINLS